MSHLHSQYITKRVTAAVLIGGMLLSFLMTGCQSRAPENQNQAFRKFTKEVFCRETSSNTISLHYTLKHPEDYDIQENPVTFGGFSTDSAQMKASAENLKKAMEKFAYHKLDVQNKLTYDILEYYLEQADKDAEYLLYEEPLGLVSGIQTQLPVVLSEYPLENEEDIKTYLSLMKTTPEYFDSLIAFEKEKSKQGLFMSDDAAKQVMKQCTAFLEMGESNYLFSTFVERIQKISGLSDSQKSDYIQKNALMINSYVLPAYSKLNGAVQELMGTGKNEAGLCYFPNGKAYYEHVVQSAVGTERTVEEMEDLTRRQMIADLEAMEQVLGISPQTKEQTESAGQQAKEQAENTGQQADEAVKGQEEASGQQAGEAVKKPEQQTQAQVEEIQETASVQVAAVTAPNPASILKKLETDIGKNFPEPPETNIRVKYVPEALEEHMSPAFYMIPAIDDYKENVIYVNKAHMGNNLTLFTTLAHEGYPGHLYQTIYYAQTEPDPIRNILNFGGYVEGWATYAEMASYSLAPLTKEQAVLLQRNSSMILGLYTLADIGIHYDGWSKSDTVAFFANYGIREAAVVERIYDLIIGSPGNYLKYYVGYLEFLELKKEWIKEKGADFSQKEFHHAVLSVGPAPFEIVEEYMWDM